MALSACGDGQNDFGRPQGKRAQPVQLVLLEDGRPAPEVLAEEQVVYRGNGEEPETLDPHLAQGVPATRILRDLFEGLTAESAAGDLVPGAALRWNISRDARTYTFYLRRDLVWSNGDPLRADDFVYGLQRAIDPETNSSAARTLLPILNAREVLAGELPVEELGISLLDEFTMQITLTGPTPYFLGLLASPVAFPVHKGNVEALGDQFSKPGNLISNGAFVLTEWTPRVSIVLEKNPRYRQAETTLIERVVYTPTEDRAAEVKQFRSGALDWTNEVPNNQFKWLQANYPDELVTSPWMGSYFLGFNLTQEPFIDNPSLRMALILSVDRQIITEKVTQFGEKPSFALVPPGIDGYVPFSPEYADWAQEERDHEARRLYEQAGYSEENPLRVEIRYNTSDNNKKIALAVASMWKQALGVNATLVNEEFRVFLQNREQKLVTQVFSAGWISDYNDPYSFLEMFRTGHGRNDYGYSNETFDALLDEVGTERVRARRERLMFEAERVLMSDHVIIPIFTYVTKRLVNPHLKGWQNNVMDHHPTQTMFKLKSSEMSSAEKNP
ncbi:MAG: peptide ABC transporter substrate-binding protein [Xanthomonadales bacterium]|jgi:oligopeptide transport system substrate-binding protein|nr:peptide ABC transporter substrate-binding protein [Xanthomonadales bacterium]MDH3923971.1 peptide ABC transporter substrate-binding protein [Xanthomonadales bacterium]MDH3939856.1 peptide ABC transporter substrate-binding protein [Xanthomonadales bacterium]MDH3999767.1 peptide ABC transporter substrate-binding protein [Xanthomonadales bacterium]